MPQLRSYVFATVLLSSQLGVVQPYTNPSTCCLPAGSHCLRATLDAAPCSAIELHGLQIASSRTAKLTTRSGGHWPAPLSLLCKSVNPRPAGGQRKAAPAQPQSTRPPPPPPCKPPARGAAPAAPARATAAERLQWAATPAAILDVFERSSPYCPNPARRTRILLTPSRSMVAACLMPRIALTSVDR